jgi:hypothetical protein
MSTEPTKVVHHAGDTTVLGSSMILFTPRYLLDHHHDHHDQLHLNRNPVNLIIDSVFDVSSALQRRRKTPSPR